MESLTCCTIVQDQNGALSCITLVKYPIPSIAPHDKMVKSTLFLSSLVKKVQLKQALYNVIHRCPKVSVV